MHVLPAGGNFLSQMAQRSFFIISIKENSKYIAASRRELSLRLTAGIVTRLKWLKAQATACRLQQAAAAALPQTLTDSCSGAERLMVMPHDA